MRVASRCRLVALALALSVLACGGEPPGTPKPGHGVIRGLDPAGAEVTIEHGEIPDLMMAMTMTFSVDDPTLLEGVAVGDEVDFLVKRDGERYVVTQVRRKAE
jgi:Cu/Ag efflux protein CusF